MTTAEDQVALRAIAFQLVRLEERCQEVLDSLAPAGERGGDVRRGGRLGPGDGAAATIECVLEVQLRPAVDSLEGAARMRRMRCGSWARVARDASPH